MDAIVANYSIIIVVTIVAACIEIIVAAYIETIVAANIEITIAAVLLWINIIAAAQLGIGRR